MSDTLQAIEYRRLVASIASHLSPEEVERILFIRREKLEALHVCGDEDTASALHMLAALERQGEFSLQNTDGLTEIAKDVNRHDLVRLIDAYKKTRCLAKKPPKIRAPKLLRKSYYGGSSSARSSRERSHLETAYEMMVTRFTFLEQQMSLIPRLLEGEGDIQDEGTVILMSLKCASEELATRLADAFEYFQELNDGGSLRGSYEDLRRTNSNESKEDQLSPDAEVIYDRPTLRAQPVEVVYDRPTHPPQPAVQNSKQLLVRPPIAMVSRRSQMLETREGTGYARPDEDTDFTGDSGFSSSSKYYDDSDPYCVVDLWRRPPPNTLAPQKKVPATDGDHGYMAVCTASLDSDPVYDTVQTPTKT